MTTNPGDVLIEFNDELGIASGNIGEVQAAVTSGREGAQDIRWAVGTFGRIETKADEVAKILGGLGDVLDLLGKVGPLRTVFNPLERVMKDLERVVEQVESKAKQIDESAVVVRLKAGVDDAITRIRELEDDVGEKRGEFDERREPVQKTVDTLQQLRDSGIDQIVDVDGLAGAIDTLVSLPRTAAVELNDLFGVETDPESVAGKLAAFNDAVEGNPLREAQRMEDDLCAIIDQLGFLSKPFDILDSILSPVRWALDASDFVFDLVVSPVLDPILDAIGVNKLFDGVRKELSKLLPDIDILDGFQTGDILPDLDAQLLPSIDLGEFLKLDGPGNLLEKAFDAINPANFSGDTFVAGTDDNDVLGDLAASVRQVLSGGFGFDNLTGGAAFGDIFAGGAGDDVIDGGASWIEGTDELLKDAVVFSGTIAEYLIEFSEDTEEIIVKHVAPLAGLLGDGTDTIRNVETFVFDGFEISAADLKDGLQLLSAGETDPVSGRSGTDANGEPFRDFLIASAAGLEGTGGAPDQGVTLNGGDGNDHLIGSRFSDDLFGGNGDDVLDGGPNGLNVEDDFDGGNGIDELTFVSSLKVGGERVDLGSGDRQGSILTGVTSADSIERIEGSEFDDIFFGREQQFVDEDPANGTYIERLSGGAGNDVLRGFGGDDRLEGGAGNDLLTGDGGVNQYLGGIGDDLMLLSGTAPGQQVDGGAGFDTLYYGGAPSSIETFDTADTAGWSTVLKGESAPFSAAFTDSAPLIWRDSFNEPGGHIQVSHSNDARWFKAPEEFTGDQSDKLGGTLSYRIRDLSDEVTGGLIYSTGEVALVGAGMTLLSDVPDAVSTDGEWSKQSVDIVASDWYMLGAPGTPVDEATLLSVLSDVEALYIRSGYRGKVETIGLDDVRFEPFGGIEDDRLIAYGDFLRGDYAVQGLTGRIEVDVAAGTVTRFDETGAEIAQDAFAGVERIAGGAFDDVFTADLSDPEAAVELAGGDGADSFAVGRGRQSVDGGAGDDTITMTTRGFSTGESFDGGAGIDTLDLSQVADARWWLQFTVLRGADWTLSEDDFFATETAQVKNIERVITGDFDDYVVGDLLYVETGAGNDFVDAQTLQDGQQVFLGDGDDEMYSFSFLNTTFDLGLGNDMAFVWGGMSGNLSTVIGGPGNATDADGEQISDDDVFLVGGGRLHVVGGDGQDIVSFGSAEIYSQNNAVTLDLSDATQNAGGAANLTYEGVENASGAAGDDIVRGDAGANLLIGGAGDDTIEGEGVAAVFAGLGAGDVLYGNAGDDQLIGHLGDDVLHGGSGNNTLIGGDGNDTASYSFTEIGAVDRAGVQQSYARDLIAIVDADLGVTGVGSAIKSRVLHRDDYESGVNGFSGGPFANWPIQSTTLDGQQGTVVGLITRASVPELNKTFDLGEVPTGPITVSFDVIEIDSWSGTPLQVSTPQGFVFIPITAGTPSATSGGGSGLSWELTPASGGAAVGGNSALDYVHKLTLTFTPTDRFVTLGFGVGFGGGGGSDDRLAIDNMLITTAETDTLFGVENLTGGALGDTLTGNGAANVLNGAEGADVLRGEGGNDTLLDGDGADIVYGGAGDDTVIAGRGDVSGTLSSFDGRDTYDGGDGFDTLDYSGFDTDILFAWGGTVIINDFVEARPVWKDDGTTGLRTFGSETFSPQSLLQAQDPSKADSADDFLRDLSAVTGPASEIEIAAEPVPQQWRDFRTGFEKLIGGSGNDTFLFGDPAVFPNQEEIFEGGLGNDLYVVAGPDIAIVEAENGGLDTVEADVDFTLPDFVENLEMTSDVFFPTGSAISGTGNSGDNRITGNDLSNILSGLGGNDILLGLLGDDTLLGGDGNDTLDGGEGFDVLDGGDGIDTLSYGTSAAGVVATLFNDGTALVTNFLPVSLGDTASGFENLEGSAQRDILTGNASDNTLMGGAGTDDLFGAGGNDVLIGGSGDDLLNGGGGLDTASYADASGSVAVYLGQPATDIGGGAGVDTLVSIENVIGSAFDDVLVGDNAGNQLSGGLGDDLLIGHGGNDLFDGGEGTDTVSYEGAGGRVAVFLTRSADVLGGQGVDTFVSIENVIGSSFSDRLVGDGQANHLIGGGGNDVIIGQAGDDILEGGNGWDTLTGSGGDDILLGGFGNDTLYGLGGEDTLDGEAGDDLLEGGLAADIMYGGNGNDLLIASFGEDILNGGRGDDELRADGSADVLNGGVGNDRLVGGNGTDRLWGGANNDVLFGGFAFLDGDGLRDEFVFKSFANGGGGFDIIRDFDDDIDKLDLTESGYTNATDVLADAYEQGADVFINFDFGGAVRIDNMTLAQLDAGDFLL